MPALNSATPFATVLEAVEQLTVEEQEDLTEIVRRRLAERGRQRIVRDVVEAEQEFASGGCRPVSVDELMKEILS